jgi:hypothetical protein
MDTGSASPPNPNNTGGSSGSKEKTKTEAKLDNKKRCCKNAKKNWRIILVIFIFVASAILAPLSYFCWKQAIIFLSSLLWLSWSITEYIRFRCERAAYRFDIFDKTAFVFWLIGTIIALLTSVERPPTFTERLNALFFGVVDFNKYELFDDDAKKIKGGDKTLNIIFGLDNSQEGLGKGSSGRMNLLDLKTKQEKYNKYIERINRSFRNNKLPQSISKLNKESNQPISWGDLLQVRLCYDLLQLHEMYDSTAKFTVLTIGDGTKQIYPLSYQNKFAELKQDHVEKAIIEILKLTNHEWHSDINDFYDTAWNRINNDTINPHIVYAYSDFFHDPKYKNNDGNADERLKLSNRRIVHIYINDDHTDSEERRARTPNTLDAKIDPDYERVYPLSLIENDSIFPHLVSVTENRTWFYDLKDNEKSKFLITIRDFTQKAHIRKKFPQTSGASFIANEHFLNDAKAKPIEQKYIQLTYRGERHAPLKGIVEFEIHHDNICYIIPFYLYPLPKYNPPLLMLFAILTGVLVSIAGTFKRKNEKIVILSLEIGNVYKNGRIETDYGDKINSRNTLYLSPKIEYERVPEKYQDITLYMKLYREGVLQRNESTSPDGYTYEDQFTGSKSKSSRLGGWGNNIKGNWPHGNYKYEIWYDSKCIGSKEFFIY